MRQLKITRSITERNEGLSKYLTSVAKIDLIKPEEEVELSLRIQKGDEEARNKLVEANLRFVISIAKQYNGENIDLLDLINEGNIGLIKAAEKFDSTRGFKFISYAVWWIRQSIIEYLAKTDTIRTPLNIIGMRNKIKRFRDKFMQENQRNPNINEISEGLGIPVDRINEMEIHGKTISYNIPVNGERNEEEIINFIEDEDAVQEETDSLKFDISRAIQTLPDRVQNIMKMAYGIDCEERTLEEIGSIMGLTRERIRQIIQRSLLRLKRGTTKEILKKYL
jgi:RNA polymerase primary sigma factor